MDFDKIKLRGKVEVRKIQHSNGNRESISFFQWIHFVIPYAYTAGIALILTWMITASILIGIATIKENPKAFILQPKKIESSISSNAEAIGKRPFHYS